MPMAFDVSDWKCAVCLEEPMCKPVVPVCGHPSCFWCVHRAMDAFGASACPTCRQPFEHLPDVCVPLHRYLARAFPAEYARRLRETHEEEETNECFSPNPSLDLDLNLPSRVAVGDERGEAAASAAPSFAFFDALERSPAVRSSQESALRDLFLCGFRDEASRETHVLRKPVVLTCGHAVCEKCAWRRLDFDAGAGSTARATRRAHRRCPACDARVVGDAPPNVCLPLHELTSAMFAGEWKDDAEEDALEPEPIAEPSNEARADETNAATSEEPSFVGARRTLSERFLRVTGQMDSDSFVHHATGCDGCGVYPIRGRRYRCADCPEAVGFDLCARCHEVDQDDRETRADIPTRLGRFNQNHTKTHVLHEIKPAPTMMHFLRSVHPDLTPAQILNLAARHASDPLDDDAEDES